MNPYANENARFGGRMSPSAQDKARRESIVAEHAASPSQSPVMRQSSPNDARGKALGHAQGESSAALILKANQVLPEGQDRGQGGVGCEQRTRVTRLPRVACLMASSLPPPCIIYVTVFPPAAHLLCADALTLTVTAGRYWSKQGGREGKTSRQTNQNASGLSRVSLPSRLPQVNSKPKDPSLMRTCH